MGKKIHNYSKAKKLQLIDEYYSGKTSKQQLCDIHKISRSTIHTWKKQLNIQNKINNTNKISGNFIVLNETSTDPSLNIITHDNASVEKHCLKNNASGIKIILPNNIMLAIDNGFDKQTLKYAIEVISTC